jgi:putative ABC transport system permease protein
MSSVLELNKLAINNLLRRKLRAYLTIIGIFIGIASIVALISLGQGLQAAILDSFSSFGPDLLLIQAKTAGFGPPGSLAGAQLTDKDFNVIRGVPGVEVVAKRTLRLATVEFKKRSNILYTTFLPDDRAARDLVIAVGKVNVGTGRMLDSGDSGRVMLGYGLSESTGPFKRTISAGDSVNINGKRFGVASILKKSGNPNQDNAVLFTEKAFDDMFNPGDTIGIIIAKVRKGTDPNKVADDITRTLGKQRGVKDGKEDFTVQTPGQVLSAFNTIINIVQAVLVGIAAISLMVGGIGVMNTMYTAVLERTREIGVIKAIGGRNSDIFMLFFFESGMLGMVGGLIGLLIGMGMAKMVEIVGAQVLGSSLLKASFPLWLILGALFFSFIIGSISGTLPAMQAAKISPVEALRK